MKKTAVSLLLEFTHSVEDYRKGNRLYYPSSSIIFIAFIGILCGAKQWDEIVEVGESCENLLKGYIQPFFQPCFPGINGKSLSSDNAANPFNPYIRRAI